MHNVQGRMCVFSRLFTENWIILEEEPLEFFKTLPLQIKLLGRIIQKKNSKHWKHTSFLLYEQLVCSEKPGPSLPPAVMF